MVTVKPLPPRALSGDTSVSNLPLFNNLAYFEVQRRGATRQIKPDFWVRTRCRDPGCSTTGDGECTGHWWPVEDMQRIKDIPSVLAALSVVDPESVSLPEPDEDEEEELRDDDPTPELEPVEEAEGGCEDEQQPSQEADANGSVVLSKPRYFKFAPLENDPIEEGRELAEASDVKLPKHKPVPKLCFDLNPALSPAILPLSEEEQIAELYRQGLLYELAKDDAHWAGFSFDAIHPSEPLYTIQHATKRRKKKPGASTALPNGDYVSDEVWDLLSQFSDVDAFDLVMLEDEGSDLESWAGSDLD
ncbi:hypothetical protein PGQ11_011336 [Apiospora arundinis]|uniref:Uncharacterized protein n=1 Tax=Apiospora arundinis TaxID=335852 RepID=A0ABR2HZ96_9PEZI